MPILEAITNTPIHYILLGLASLLLLGMVKYELERVLSALVKHLPVSELEEEEALFALPFFLSLGFAITDTSSDRQPTPEEYEVVRGLIAAWLHESMAAYYADHTKRSFVRVKVALNKNQTVWNTSKRFPHQVSLDCQAIFFATEAARVPDQVSFGHRFFAKLGYHSKCVPAIKYTGPEDCIFRLAKSYGTNIETKGNPRRFAPAAMGATRHPPATINHNKR